MNHIMHNISARRDIFSRRAFFSYNTPSKQRLNVRITKGAVFMKQNQVIDEINYYKAQAITELLYARGMITFDEYDVIEKVLKREKKKRLWMTTTALRRY